MEKTDSDLTVSSADKNEVAEIDRKILLEYIAIDRFNIHFQQAANRHRWWRLWLYPIAQESGTAACLANTLVGLSQRARGLDNPDLISTPSLKRGTSSNLVGKTINGSSSAFELTQNALVMWHAKHMGYSPRQSVFFIKTSLARVDALLAERQAIAAGQPQGRTRDIRELEGRLLDQIRNQLAYEFRKWSVHSREIAWKENSFYAIDSLQNFTAATGSILALKGFTDSSARGAAILSTLTANSLAALNPIIRTQVGVFIRKYQRRQLAKDFPATRPQLTKTLMPDWADLDSLRTEDLWPANDQRSLKEVALLSQSSERLDEILSKEVDTVQKLRRIASQQEISGPLIGLAGVSRSTIESVAYYGYRSDRLTSTRLNFAGALPQTVGQSYALLNTPITQIAGLIHYRKLEARNESPTQILQRRLDRLDGLEAQVRFPR